MICSRSQSATFCIDSALVVGGSGGIGTFLVQLLKSWEAHVVATCSDDASELVNKLGADEVIDYHNLDNLKPFADRFDLIIDCSRQSTSTQERQRRFLLQLLKPNSASRFVTLSPPLLRNVDAFGLLLGTAISTVQASRETLDGIASRRSGRWAFFCPNHTALDRIRILIELDKIKPVVQQVFAFDQLPRALLKMRDEKVRGKVVVEFEENKSDVL